jgi:hypothetical protein
VPRRPSAVTHASSVRERTAPGAPRARHSPVTSSSWRAYDTWFSRRSAHAEESLPQIPIKVTISGPRIPLQTVKETLDAAGLEEAEVTWSTPDGSSDDTQWRITVATGHRVAVGALPPDRPATARVPQVIRTDGMPYIPRVASH